jgi:hypothetical protein
MAEKIIINLSDEDSEEKGGNWLTRYRKEKRGQSIRDFVAKNYAEGCDKRVPMCAVPPITATNFTASD